VGVGVLPASRRQGSPAPDPDSLRRQNRALRQLVDSLNHLTAVALEAGDVTQITGALAGRLKRSVAVFSPGLEPLACAGSDGVENRALLDARSDRRLAAALEGIGETRRAVRIPAAIGASHLRGESPLEASASGNPSHSHPPGLRGESPLEASASGNPSHSHPPVLRWESPLEASASGNPSHSHPPRRQSTQ